MFRYIIIVLIISFMSIAHSREKIVLTSFYPIHIATMNVAAGVPNLKVLSLTKPFVGCLHDYQLTPKDMTILSKADFFVINGAGMESFLDKVLKSQKNLKIIEASKDIALLKDESSPEGNPHVWLSIPLAMTQVRNIAKRLGEEIPESRVMFEKNANDYIEKLTALDKEFKIESSKLKSRSFVTFHEAFPYFAHEYNLTIASVIEREPGTEPTSREMANIIKKLKASPVKVIFAEPQYSPKSAQMIAKESGAKVFSLDPIVTGEYSKDAYLKAMKSNLETLKKALN